MVQCHANTNNRERSGYHCTFKNTEIKQLNSYVLKLYILAVSLYCSILQFKTQKAFRIPIVSHQLMLTTPTLLATPHRAFIVSKLSSCKWDGCSPRPVDVVRPHLHLQSPGKALHLATWSHPNNPTKEYTTKFNNNTQYRSSVLLNEIMKGSSLLHLVRNFT